MKLDLTELEVQAIIEAYREHDQERDEMIKKLQNDLSILEGKLEIATQLNKARK